MIVRRLLLRRCILGTLLAGGLWCALPAARGEDSEAEYQRRFNALDGNDLEGHYQLALWCKDNKAYRLLRRQATYILRKNKDHAPAKLLLKLAGRELDAARQREEDAKGPGDATGGALGRILTDREVQLLRRAEMLLDGTERVRVKFYNRVVERFFSEKQGTSGFDYDRRAFFKLPPVEKAELILRLAPDTLGEDVDILSDPQRFKVFDRQVMPVVLEKCATAACHGRKGRGDWRIYSDKRPSTNQVYTNYLIMHEYSLGNDRLIDRDHPEESLLLKYGLPQGARDHSVPIDPAFRTDEDRKYQAILDWVKSLSVPGPDYGISLSSAPENP